VKTQAIGDGFRVLSHPYRKFVAPEDPSGGLGPNPPRGCVLVWWMAPQPCDNSLEIAQHRTPGIPLVLLLPPAHAVTSGDALLRLVELCRPMAILPHHPRILPREVLPLLRRGPIDLPGDVLDYMTWRGITVPTEGRRLVLRLLELSGELRSVSAVARALHTSRRALGRQLSGEGLPVPSHWLQLGRSLRAAVDLQDTDRSLFSIAIDHGYSDGFSLSNQMQRIFGFRPSVVREFLGWEWILETWLHRQGLVQSSGATDPAPSSTGSRSPGDRTVGSAR